MSVRTRIAGLLVFTLIMGLMSLSLVEGADKYPSKPIELIVPYAAGGSTDVCARIVAKVAPKYFPQPLVIINKPGGGAIPGREYVVRSKPDGYTLLFGYGSGEDLVVPNYRPLPFDTFKDLVPVCRISIHSVAIVVSDKSPYKTVEQFVKYAKSKKSVTASASSKGAAVEIVEQAFAKRAGFKVVVIPFRGGAESVPAVVGGHVDFGGGHPSEILPHIKSGRLVPLAVAREERDPSIPDVPTFRELGYDVVTAGSVKGVAVPKGTPQEIIDYLNEKFKQICQDPEFIQAMKEVGQPVDYMGPVEYAKYMKDCFEEYGRLIKELGITMG
ncbi:MAG TPA: tripartite tricarboxylate transporter substrate binding protein [Firmicutes bacterium]|nr:tripartite tricarboxylate transporter substrate binding protein [Bacillota bacterium]